MYGISFKNKHSYDDFGLTIKSKELSPPKKIKIKDKVPFMNGAYDFSGLYGEQSYEERELQYVFNLVCKNKIEMNIKKMQILDWLMNSFKDTLKDDVIQGYYFLAECEDVDFNEDGFQAEINVSFSAYPFKLSDLLEGNDIWNSFNFELDYAQNTKFDVDNSLDITLYNLGVKKLTPSVICSTSMQVIKGSTTYNFNSGTSKDWRFSLDLGENNLTLKGNGTIEFLFRKEVL